MALCLPRQQGALVIFLPHTFCFHRVGQDTPRHLLGSPAAASGHTIFTQEKERFRPSLVVLQAPSSALFSADILSDFYSISPNVVSASSEFKILAPCMCSPCALLPRLGISAEPFLFLCTSPFEDEPTMVDISPFCLHRTDCSFPSAWY